MFDANFARHLSEPMGFMPSRRMRSRFMRELEQARIGAQPCDAPIITPADVEALPEPARRCFAFAGAVGLPRVWSVRAHAMGVFRVSAAKPWMHCETWQYDARDPIARSFQRRLRYGHVVPMLVRDLYTEGRGRVFGRVLDTFSVVDEDHDFVTLGELSSFVSDAMLLAPSLLLGAATRWIAVNESAFDVELRDHGWSVSARVVVDPRGAVTEVSSEDRYFAPTAPGGREGRPSAPPPSAWTRARWSVPVTDWASGAGRRFARRAQAIWHLPSGDFQDAELLFDRVDVNVLAREELARVELGDV
ncbi:MAG: DUF6544 family protein [Polyangiaceae bacterium]